MKLVKAFVRTSKVNEAIRAFEDAGAPGITVSQVHGVGYGYEPMLFTLAPGEMRKNPEVAKIEVVCADAQLEPLLETLVAAARTGDPGDGIVFVTPVEPAIKIRTGSTGGEALAAPKRRLNLATNQEKEATMPSKAKPLGRVTFGITIGAVALLTAALAGAAERGARPAGIRFSDATRQAAEFIEYDAKIKLTPEQQKVMDEALSAFPAPCCAEYSMATCCCPCNLARSVWGFSKVLITKYHYGAKQVEAAAREWLSFTNPHGYTGNACFTGGCNRSFNRNGCGGMDASRIS